MRSDGGSDCGLRVAVVARSGLGSGMSAGRWLEEVGGFFREKPR
jgi:hypothetical protein